MCTYHIALDNSLVMQAENAFQIKESFQVWLQQQVERWLLAQVNGKSQSQSKHSRLSDEELKEKLSAYPPLEESCFPSLAAEDYGTYLNLAVANSLKDWKNGCNTVYQREIVEVPFALPDGKYCLIQHWLFLVTTCNK